MLRLLALLCSHAALGFQLPAAAVLRPAAPRARPRMLNVDPQLFADASATAPLINQIGSTLAFSDQGGNLAGVFFQFSLPSYLAFLYFIGYEKNRTPKLGLFGFQFLLLFVISTIPTGIISKATYGCTLADADWLHGSAEALLTVTNLLIAAGFRAASCGDTAGEEGALTRKVALGLAALVALVCASGTSLGFGAHTPFMFGVGNLDAATVAALPWVAHAEPANALSLPTWAIHSSSVFEWLFAMQLVWKYASVTGNEKWKGLTWGMLPLHASGVAACTYHFFFNPSSLQFLVELQAFLTLLGNTTLAIAAIRIALSNGWTLSELNPFDKSKSDKEEALPALRTSPADNEFVLFAQLFGLTFACAYAVKYGELALGGADGSPFGANPIVAGLMVLLPPAVVAYSYIGASEGEKSPTTSLP
ncbi:hypothetical protein AB1Y20_005894 [Prymnesium parvum]|uniref:Ycf49-like protein n=1 Tax=Prymnesium parvum TaxID=97485 RepID=A0AB34J3F6_PRYPA